MELLDHPTNEANPLTLHPWQLRFTTGNMCAALLLGLFEQDEMRYRQACVRHDRDEEAAMREQLKHPGYRYSAGEPPSGLMRYSTNRLYHRLLGLCDRGDIMSAMRKLAELHVIIVHQSPASWKPDTFDVDWLYHIKLGTLEEYLHMHNNPPPAATPADVAATKAALDSMQGPLPTPLPEGAVDDQVAWNAEMGEDV